jgi:hypothetical protein
VQQQIRKDFADGDEAWAFYAQKGIANALTDSLSYYADAYKAHNGDREAVRGLKRAADEALKNARSDPSRLRDTARNLAGSSEYLKTYPPVMEALGR